MVHALKYAEKGIPVFPCHNKKPLTPHGFKDASTSPEQIRSWWGEHPNAQIGTPTGASFWTLDVDLPDGPESLQALIDKHGPLPPTRTMRTGGGGLQYFFKVNGAPIKNSAGKIGRGVDVRGRGGYTILPPSGHPSGGLYFWERNARILDAPEWLLDLVTETLEEKASPPISNVGTSRYGERALADEITKLSGAAEGTRNDRLNRTAFNLGQLVAGGELDRGTVENALLGVAFGLRLNEREARKTIESGLSSSGKHPRSAPEKELNQEGVATPHEEGEPIKDPIDILNEKHAVVMVGGQCLIMNEEIDRDTGRPSFSLSPEKAFGLRYRNWKVQLGEGEQAKHVPATKLWLESPKRREYAGIAFEPGEEPDGYYNLWRGWAIDPKPGSWTAFKDHIYESICAANPGLTDWVLGWMAWIVQNPGGPRPETCLVLRGGQGTGKGVFAKTFGRLFGQHFQHVSQQAHVVGRFNGHLKDTILLFGDESFFAGDKRDAAVLKALITEQTRILEEKYVNPIAVRNLVNLILASNSTWVVPAEMDERRFAVFDVAAAHQQDRKFFAKIHKQMTEEGGLEAMLYDLQEREIETDPHVIPSTEGLLEQKIHSLESPQAYWYRCLSTGTLLDGQDLWPDEVPKGKLHEDYLRYCHNAGERHPAKIRQFGKALKGLCGLQDYRPRTPSGERPNHYKIPRLEECRAQFEQAIGTTINWDEA